MLKLVKSQQFLIGAMASLTLLLLGLAILGISLWSVNQEAVGIKVFF